MKIGFSFGRCVASIVRGEVTFDDVLCIIARTQMASENHVRAVVASYMTMPGYMLGLDHAACEDIGVRLFNAGKILEPRANGIRPMSVPRDYIWMDMFPTAPAGVASDAVKAAWEDYRLLITLTEQLPEEGYVPEHSEKMIPRTLTPEEEETNRKMLDMLINSI